MLPKMAPLESGGAFNRQLSPRTQVTGGPKGNCGTSAALAFSGRGCGAWLSPAGTATVAVPEHQVPTVPELWNLGKPSLFLRGLFWAFSIVTES